MDCQAFRASSASQAMTLTSNTQANCPFCSKEVAVTMYSSVNVTHNPELKTPLLQQVLNWPKCSHCSAFIPLAYEHVYHDMHKKLMIQAHGAPPKLDLEMDPEMQLPASYTLRLVDSWEQLIEKVLIADQGLDDRVVEAVKYGICDVLGKQYAEPLRRMGAIPLNFGQMLFVGKMTLMPSDKEPGGEQLSFLQLSIAPSIMFALSLLTPFDSYRAAENRVRDAALATLEAGSFHRVNYPWAQRVFGSHPVRLHVRMLAGLGLLDSDPVAKSIWHKHVLYLKYLAHTQKPPPSSEKKGWFKRLFGG